MATTTNYGWPTPDNTDRVADGASAMRALADAIDADVPRLEVIEDSVGSTASGDTNTTTVFFTGTYASAPVVLATAKTGGIAVVTVSSISTSDCLVTVKNVGGTGIAGNFALLVVSA